MTLINMKDAKDELVRFLRNQDVLTIEQRGIITSEDTGTFSADSSYLIDNSQVKNIRSIVVDAVTLTHGTDYTYNTEYDDSGTKKCKITFTSAQTGDYTINFDYGPDSIFPDYSRTDLDISSYPRIEVEQISKTTNAFGVGGSDVISDTVYTVIVVAATSKQVENILADIEGKFIQNQTGFYYHNVIHPVGMGPIKPKDNAKAQVYQRNLDVRSRLNVES